MTVSPHTQLSLKSYRINRDTKITLTVAIADAAIC